MTRHSDYAQIYRARFENCLITRKLITACYQRLQLEMSTNDGRANIYTLHNVTYSEKFLECRHISLLSARALWKRFIIICVTTC